MGPLDVISKAELASLCQRHRIVELSIFGSQARGDAGPKSDVDVMVAFEDGAALDVDDYERLESELATLFGRRVDLVNERYLRNPIIRREAMTDRKVLYAGITAPSTIVQGG